LNPNRRIVLSESFMAHASISTGIGKLGAEIYRNVRSYSLGNTSGKSTRSGLNILADLRLWKVDLQTVYNYILQFEDTPPVLIYPRYTIPETSGNILLSFHDAAFKSKFEYKVGIHSRFWWDYWAVGYNGFYNLFHVLQPNSPFIIGRNFTLDFFVIGKIEKAIFGLTLENILNRIYYTTGLYPGQRRGGLANVISRFNVTWYFLN